MVDIWQRFRVTWHGLTQLCGSVPADPEIVSAWLKARQPRVRPPGGKSMDEVQQEVYDSLERGEEFDETSSNILVFQRHAGAICVRAATIRAHLKDCSRQLSGMYGREQGERAFSTRVVNDLYLDDSPYWIPILRPDGTPLPKHDGERDKAVHPKPGISALKRFEYVEPWRLDFVLKVLAPEIKGKRKARLQQADLEILMQYGGTHGYAGERGDGEGKYAYEIKEV